MIMSFIILCQIQHLLSSWKSIKPGSKTPREIRLRRAKLDNFLSSATAQVWLVCIIKQLMIRVLDYPNKRVTTSNTTRATSTNASLRTSIRHINGFLG
ncbi:LOW QUALITY PROTEIN: hypothetical protein TorRG33x02_145970 [Trema orientale]|uniref:Uncharacterized protein n=1 Tax=Trema orientale TaxID=63057 RepID=A0A2P5EVS8_TREOI|nr:LOW QUALITY PROTEIN: hypothetical protein TorRG33x02_145970 [Trema orientale]